jgi:pyruvate dehydrogenase E2 component (dihydrolipoamide acetyltransferase)
VKENTMPCLSDSTEEGTILGWLKADGEYVAKGEELFDIATDKATMTYHSEADGVLAIVATEGTTVGTVMPDSAHREQQEPPLRVQRSPTIRRAWRRRRHPLRRLQQGRLEMTGEPNAIVRATPVARRLAAEHGVDLRAIDGSGPGGRVLLSAQTPRSSSPESGNCSSSPLRSCSDRGGST